MTRRVMINNIPPLFEALRTIFRFRNPAVRTQKLHFWFNVEHDVLLLLLKYFFLRFLTHRLAEWISNRVLCESLELHSGHEKHFNKSSCRMGPSDCSLYYLLHVRSTNYTRTFSVHATNKNRGPSKRKKKTRHYHSKVAFGDGTQNASIVYL